MLRICSAGSHAAVLFVKFPSLKSKIFSCFLLSSVRVHFTVFIDQFVIFHLPSLEFVAPDLKFTSQILCTGLLFLFSYKTMVCTRQSSASEKDQGAKSPLAGTSNKQKKKKKSTSKSGKLEFQYFPDQIRLSGCFFEISRVLK